MKERRACVYAETESGALVGDGRAGVISLALEAGICVVTSAPVDFVGDASCGLATPFVGCDLLVDVAHAFAAAEMVVDGRLPGKDNG